MGNTQFNKAEYLNAILAEDSYSDHKHRKRDVNGNLILNENGNPVVSVTYPDGETEDLEVIEDFPNENNPIRGDSFNASIYQSQTTKAFHGAIRGSEEVLGDFLWADGAMVFTRTNPQFDEAREFAYQLFEYAKLYGEAKDMYPNVYLTGHSLAGAEVEYLKHYFGDAVDHAYTYNGYGAAGLGYRIPADAGARGISNLCMATDVVCAVSPHYGPVKKYATAEEIQVLEKEGGYANHDRRLPFTLPLSAGRLDPFDSRSPVPVLDTALGKHYIRNFTEPGTGVLTRQQEYLDRTEDYRAMVGKFDRDLRDNRIYITYGTPYLGAYNAVRTVAEGIVGDVEAGARAKADGFHYESTEQSRRKAEEQSYVPIGKGAQSVSDSLSQPANLSLAEKIALMKTAAASDSDTFARTINVLGDNESGKAMMQRADESIEHKQQLLLRQEAQQQEAGRGMSMSR